jgi:tetratricopeptide (TPR) repeat protein
VTGSAWVRVLRALAFAFVVPVTAPLGAQAPEPDRPPLPAGTDPRRWEGYFDLGAQVIKKSVTEAEVAFYWANKLDPTRAEPLFARYAAFFIRSRAEDVRAYLRDDPELMKRPDVLAADSMRSRALMRNPFVHRGLELLIFDRLPGGFAEDRDTRAWIAYSNGEFQKAIDLYTKTIERDGRSASWRRYDRAVAYVAMGNGPAALADLRALLADLRKADERGAVTFYRSKHFLLYMIGMLQTQLRDYAGARTTFQESLVEDAAFAYGNAGLAGLSRLQRAPAQAAGEYALAVDLAPDDGVLRHRYAEVLHDLQREDEAVEQLARAIALEPHWPAPVLLLGRVREKQGNEAAAFEQYTRYVSMSPASDTPAKNLKLRIDLRAQRTP